MPTGYTAPVQDGTVVEFKDFAMQCARAFGGMIHMREDSQKAEYRPATVSDYYPNAIESTLAEIAEVEAWTAKDAMIAALTAWGRNLVADAEARKRSAAYKERYDAMLAQVATWEPPTEEHQGLKDFMVSQLEDSIKFDVHDYDERPLYSDLSEPTDGFDFKAQKLASLYQSLAYHQAQFDEDIESMREKRCVMYASIGHLGGISNFSQVYHTSSMGPRPMSMVRSPLSARNFLTIPGIEPTNSLRLSAFKVFLRQSLRWPLAATFICTAIVHTLQYLFFGHTHRMSLP